MSEKYHYESGAIHHDHHQEINIGSVSAQSLETLIKAFFKDDAEEAEIEEEIKEETQPEVMDETPKQTTRQPKVEPDLPPVDKFVNRVKAIVRLAATKNGQKIVTNTRAWHGEYVFFVDGERIAKMMDDLRKNHEKKVEEFLQLYQKCDGITVVAPFIGKILDIEELRAQDLQKSDLAFAFTPYYNNRTSAVKRMSDKLDSEAAKVLLGTFQGLLKKYPKA